METVIHTNERVCSSGKSAKAPAPIRMSPITMIGSRPYVSDSLPARSSPGIMVRLAINTAPT